VIETNLSGQIRSTIPARAPSFFMLDIPAEEVPAFRAMASAAAPQGDLVTIPSLRGSVVALGDRRVADMEEIPDDAWFLRGDRGLTYAATVPEAAGWWRAPGGRPTIAGRR
jgi:putative ABC transport system permease protein